MKKGTFLDKLKLDGTSYMLKLEFISFKITVECSLHNSMIEGHRQSLMPFLIALSNASHAMHQSKLTSYLIYVLFVARSASEFMCLKMLFFFPDKTEQIPYGFISTIHVYMKSILWMYPGCSVYAQYYQIYFFQSPFHSSSCSSLLHPPWPPAPNAIKSSWMYSDFSASIARVLSQIKNELMPRVRTWQQINFSSKSEIKFSRR